MTAELGPIVSVEAGPVSDKARAEATLTLVRREHQRLVAALERGALDGARSAMRVLEHYYAIEPGLATACVAAVCRKRGAR